MESYQFESDLTGFSEKFRIREIINLSTDANSSTDIISSSFFGSNNFFSERVQKQFVGGSQLFFVLLAFQKKFLEGV